jgi:hypothetical protein
MTKYLTQITLREELFILAHSFRDVSPSWQRGCGIIKQYISWKPGSRVKGIQGPGQDTASKGMHLVI